MKTLKVMSILSLIITAISLLCIIYLYADASYSSLASAAGWGEILAFWSIAYSIVALVQSKKK